MPGTDELHGLLQMLFGEDATVETIEQVEGVAPTNYTASFVNQQETHVANCCADLPFVAYAGAALSMLPKDFADDVAGGKDEITDVMRDNFHEVMNILSTVLMNDSTPHLRLNDVTTNASESLAEAASKSFKVEIPKYGSGVFTLVIT